jgi:hypothetical protein
LARITRLAGATDVVVEDAGAAGVGDAVGTVDAEPAIVVGTAAVVEGEPIGTGALVTIVATAVGGVIEDVVEVVEVDDVVVEVVVAGEALPPQPPMTTNPTAQATTRRDMDSESRSPLRAGEVNG